MKCLNSCLALILVACVCSPAKAILFASESFDYPGQGPAINGLDGGFGWAVGWEDADSDFQRLTTDNVSLDFDSYPFTPAGNRLENASASPAAEAVRNFAPNRAVSLASEGQVLYASVLLNKLSDGGTGSDNVEFVLGNNGGQTIRFGMSSPDRFFLGDSAANAQFDTITFGQSYMLVMKVTAHAAIPDVLQGMVYTQGETVPTVEPTTWDIEHTSFLNSAAVLNSVRLLTGANARGAFDEIRLGYSWGSVVDPNFVPGDFNSNGFGPDDYLALRSNMFTGTTYTQGDMNGSGLVDLQDFILFREVWNAQGLGAFPGSENVPEPSAIALALLGGLVGGVVYWRHSRRRNSNS